MSTNLDPAFERDELAPYVEMFNQGRAQNDVPSLNEQPAVRQAPERRIAAAVRYRSWRHCAPSGAIHGAKTRGSQCWCASLWRSIVCNTGGWSVRKTTRTMDQRSRHRLRPTGIRQPLVRATTSTRRHRTFATRCLFTMTESYRLNWSPPGRAIAGTIIDVWDEGQGRKTCPVWVVESNGDLPLRLREDSELCVVGLRDRRVRIRSFEKTPEVRYRFELEVVGLPTVPRGNSNVLPAKDPRHKGQSIVLVKPSMDQIARRKSRMIWNRDVPGAWLTHSVPQVLEADLPGDIGEDLSELKDR